MGDHRWLVALGGVVALGTVAACAGSSPSTDGPSPPAATTAVASTVVASSAVTAATTIARAAAPTTLPAPYTTVPGPPPVAGAVRHQLRFGPITVEPGQNAIEFSGAQVPKPPTDGWIVRIAPNVVRGDETVPGVNVIHLHHGVWLNLARQDSTVPGFPERFFAAGEEKTISTFPAGYGYRYVAADPWAISFMLHSSLPITDQVWLTYDVDVIPAAAAPADMREVRPIWLDVENGEPYPVFDVLRGTGATGRFTYPTDAPDAYGDGPAKNEWVVDRDGVLVATAGHVHPGGLYTDLSLARPGRDQRASLFRSEAVYWEPAGPVSWDLAMTATPPDWQVAVRAGDRLAISTTYDAERASWYESMGIMVVYLANGPGGDDPFEVAVDRPGAVTHGPLPENGVHGGEEAGLPDARSLPGVPAPASITIADWLYAAGDTSETATAVPEVPAGQSLTFVNEDAPLAKGIWHTVTACKAPCNRATGIAYPLADADLAFDSGELGLAGPPTADRVTWSTPADLPVGTYTYFCRIHPIMRGAFRVTDP